MTVKSPSYNGYACVVCTLPIRSDAAMVGARDGTGRRFAHVDCYWKREAERLAAENKRLKKLLKQ